ncbi:TonB-dependent receptor [Pseudogemmatithrix spongiicola]|uniref:TonB-dependent receptor n=1 Tax=Pseudogemmatithrix spongiicola TaxID=3062599 RepID=A0AA49JW58_9BACT|nr:TonB-dependent receptor [Gemmatimonadaceae bacterium 'strain 138']WKW16032.1 TonB-dependent receptor [Gemmatimonadaceae bacterium 'strain 318']
MLAVLGFVAAAGAADAQSGTVAGRVTQSDGGAALADAQVQVLTGATAIGSIRTGADGSYRIGNIPAGTYTVVARAGGYVMKRVENVNVAAGGTATVNIAMDAVVSRLDAVVTTTTRGAEPEKILDSPNSISLISSERIAERPAATITDHLKGQPGLSISNGGIVQANIVSRGFNNAFSTSMLMLQDYRFAGVPSLRVNVPFLFTGTGEDIDRIEVLQGPASALYGPNSGSGVLHVITKSPFQSQGTTLTLDGGERSMFRLAGRHAQRLNDQFAFKFSGEYFRANDWEYNDPNEPANWSGTDARVPASRQGQPVQRDFGLERYSGEARLDYKPNEDTEAITTFGYTMAGSALEITTTFGAAQVQNWSYTNFQQRFRHKQFFAQVFYNQSNSGNADAGDDKGTFYLRSGIPVVDQSSVLVAQLQQGYTLGNTKLTAGLDYIATTPETKGTIMGRNEGDDNILETGGYLQFTTPLTDKLDLMGAVRGDMNSRIEGTQFSPRAAFLYKATPTQNFRFTFNRAFNSPASFSFFLDQWSGQTANLGPAINNPTTGNTEIRIFGNPAKDGWRYNRGCAASQTDAAGLCMRSNFYGATPNAVAGSTLLPATMNAGLSTQLVAGIATTFGLTPTQQTNIRNALNGLAPTNAQVPLILRNVLAGNAVTPFSSVSDYSPLGANFSNTWELGYKGIIGDRLRLSVDYWYQIRPAEPTTQVINADDIVFFNPATLGAYLGAPATGVTAALAANGVPAAAIGTVITNWTTSLAGLPTGTLAFDNDLYDRSYLVFTYQNAEGHVDVRGIDAAVDYLFNDMYSVEATYSTISRNVFRDARGATPTNPLVANTPRHRASLTFRRVDDVRGLNMELRGRYADAFDVNSGVFNSFNVGTPVPYTRVPVNAFVDAGFSWKLPVAQNVRWSLNIQNLLDNQVPSFIGVAPVGRFATTRVSYSF